MATLAHYQAQAEAALRMKAMQAEVERWKSLAERLQAQADEMRGGRQWISVEDRLPEARDGTRYLVARDCGNGTLKSTSVGFLLGGEWHISDDVRSFRDIGYRVTHWMPLPASPTTSGDGQHE